MREKQTPWSLKQPWCFAGEIMLQDEEYIQQTRQRTLSECDRMIDELKGISTYKVYPAYANFILPKIQKDGLTSYDLIRGLYPPGPDDS